jgi:hypothetical protein
VTEIGFRLSLAVLPLLDVGVMTTSWATIAEVQRDNEDSRDEEAASFKQHNRSKTTFVGFAKII